MADAGTIQSLTEQGHAVAALDAEHEAIGVSLRELQAAVMADASGETIARILSVCIEFCRAHFAHEEQFMREHGHPHLDTHQNAHRWLSEQFERARSVVLDHDLAAGLLDGYDLLYEFEKHVEKYDRPMHDEISVRMQQAHPVS